MRYLTVALTKGRLAQKTLDMFEQIGITCEEMRDKDTRKLIFVNEDLKLRFFLAKGPDVPTYVEYGAADLEVFRKKNCHDTEEYELILNRIQEQTGRLSHLISTLLDMTNLNSVPRNDSISLAALTEEVLCDLDSIADQAHITLQQKEVIS